MTIRQALPIDSQAGAQLAYLAMGCELADYLLGLGDADRAKQVMADLFSREGNRLSFLYADVAIQNDQVAGLLIAYPGRIMQRLTLTTARELIRVYTLPESWRLLRRAFPLSRIKEAERDEYHISSVAVLPQFRGLGIGRRLLARAEEQAKKEGLKKCSLAVKIGNDKAFDLYKRLGYEVVGIYQTQRLGRLIGYRGVHRMVKKLPSAPSFR